MRITDHLLFVLPLLAVLAISYGDLAQFCVSQREQLEVRATMMVHAEPVWALQQLEHSSVMFDQTR